MYYRSILHVACVINRGMSFYERFRFCSMIPGSMPMRGPGSGGPRGGGGGAGGMRGPMGRGDYGKSSYAASIDTSSSQKRPLSLELLTCRQEQPAALRQMCKTFAQSSNHSGCRVRERDKSRRMRTRRGDCTYDHMGCFFFFSHEQNYTIGTLKTLLFFCCTLPLLWG